MFLPKIINLVSAKEKKADNIRKSLKQALSRPFLEPSETAFSTFKTRINRLIAAWILCSNGAVLFIAIFS